MYVCVCHALTDKQVSRVLDEGARTAATVFQRLGRKVQCGKCVGMVRDMVRDRCGNHCHSCESEAASDRGANDNGVGGGAAGLSHVLAYGVAAE